MVIRSLLVAGCAAVVCAGLAGCASGPREEKAVVCVAVDVSGAASVRPGTNDLTTPDRVVLPAGAAEKPVPFEGQGWEPMFDEKVWAGWKETEFSGRGPIRVEQGVITFGMGDPFTGVNWTNHFPTRDYEIAFDAMRVMGADFFCGLTFPVNQSFCSLILGGWGGSLAGISSINGMDASENETTKYLTFENGRWYRVRVRVTDGRIEAWVDKDKIVNLVITGIQLKVRPGEIEQSIPLGLASWQTGAAFREIRYRRVAEADGPAPKQF